MGRIGPRAVDNESNLQLPVSKVSFCTDQAREENRATVLLSLNEEIIAFFRESEASPKREFLFLLVGLETLFKRVRRYGRE